MRGGFHSQDNGCNVAVNLKRVADEAGPVLKGIGEALAAVSKIQSELAKGKDCGEVYDKLTNFVQTGGDMLKHLKGAVEFSKQRLKTSTMNQPRMQDTQDTSYGLEKNGECKRGSSCPFSHPDVYKGTKKGSGAAGVQPAKPTGPVATAPAVPTTVPWGPTSQGDGPVAGML